MQFHVPRPPYNEPYVVYSNVFRRRTPTKQKSGLCNDLCLSLPHSDWSWLQAGSPSRSSPNSCHRCPVEVTLVVCSCSVRPGWCEAAGQSGTVESSFVIISCGFLAFPFLIGISFGFECSSRLIFRRRFQRPPPSPILHRVNRICIIKAKINKSKL